MPEAFRLPFLTEGTITYPGGMSDPDQKKHRTLEDAEDYARAEAVQTGGTYRIYRITKDQDCEEIGVVND